MEERGREGNGHINWQLWFSFANFKEIYINWHCKGKIDNLIFYNIGV